MNNILPFKLIKQLAAENDFGDCGAVETEVLPAQFFYEYLNKDYNASMDYLSRNVDKRLNPQLLFPNAQTIISFVIPYKHLPPLNNYYHEREKRAEFAQVVDYHKFIKNKLYTIAEEIKTVYATFDYKVCVDSVPVFEKIWAMKAGLGFIGKNSLFYSRKFGSKVFLGEIITNYKLNVSHNSYLKCECGDCSLCIDACPNGAIDNGMINANLCISFHTIESKKEIPPHINTCGYTYGCDICQNVCPLNKKI
jgi:epoxyqueuosine reductase